MKSIFITGASSDVGIRLIERIIDQYDNVICHYCYSSEKLNELRERYGSKIELYQADFLDEQAIEEMMDDINKRYIITHIVHLPAYKYEMVKFHKTSIDSFKKEFEIEVFSVFRILQKCLPTMSKNNYGRIVFMLSSCVEGIAPKYLSAYVTTKYALLGLMKSLSSEYIEKNITINGVAPGMIQTRFLKDIPEITIQMHKEDTSKKSLVDIDSVVATFEFLLSDEAKFICGEKIVIDGEA